MNFNQAPTDITCIDDLDWMLDRVIEDTSDWKMYADTTLEFALDETRYDQLIKMTDSIEIDDPDVDMLYFWYRGHVWYRGSRNEQRHGNG